MNETVQLVRTLHRLYWFLSKWWEGRGSPLGWVKSRPKYIHDYSYQLDDTWQTLDAFKGKEAHG